MGSVRFYDIVITDPNASDQSKPLHHFTSHPNGKMAPPDAGALHVTMDLISVAEATAAVNSHLKIWGVSLQTIAQATNLNPVNVVTGAAEKAKNIVVRGGMGKGLPLAKPQQAGKLVEGQIIQAFGNWIGTNMTLDLLIAPGVVTAPAPKQPNITFNYKAGQQLADAIQATLNTAFPQLNTLVKIGKSLVLNYDQPGFYGTLEQFARYIKGISKVIQTAPDYPGVEIAINQKTITVYDGSSAGLAKQIAFDDLVGQPTWIEPRKIQVTCVMRADILMGDYIKLPKTLVTTAAASASGFAGLKQGPVFSGTFLVNDVIRHVGDYKSPAGEAWVTYLTCTLVSTAAEAPLEPTNLSSQSTENIPGT